MSEPEVVCKNKRCREIVRELKKSDVISVDAEGVNLGKEGPLTLLQIGTIDGQVYLFDVHINPEIFRRGKLIEILQSDKIVKVMHSSKGDSAALFFQFDIQLQNVFDTQVAHLVIEEHKGRILPRCIKLSDICCTYSENAEVSEEKDEIKQLYTTKIGNFWEIRPLTDEMIAYASGDVTALIPEVYETQKEYMELNSLLPKFDERVTEEVNYAIDKKMSKQRFKRQQNVIKSITDQLQHKYPSSIKYEDITDEDDIAAIRRLKLKTRKVHPLVKRLKTESIKAQLLDLSCQLSDDENDFIPKYRSYAFLREYEYHSDDEIKHDAKRILKRIQDIILENMIQKYKRGTCTNMLALNEKEALNTLRPKGVRDRNIHPILLSLYWQMQEENLDSTIDSFDEKREDYVIPEGFYKWIKFCCVGKVPEQIKAKARKLVRNFDRTFGKGIVPGRQSTSE